MTTKAEYPQWVCFDCGRKHGRRAAGLCTMHQGTCGVCGKEDMVTEPRDFGHLKDGWENEPKEKK